VSLYLGMLATLLRRGEEAEAHLHAARVGLVSTVLTTVEIVAHAGRQRDDEGDGKADTSAPVG
jgi:hypothetical protein